MNLRPIQQLTSYMILFILMVTAGAFIPWQSATATDKELYLHRNYDLTRIPYVGTQRRTAGEGVTRNWLLNPALAANLTVLGSTNNTIDVTLNLGEAGNGQTRDFTLSLISSDGGIGTFATQVFTNIDLNPQVTSTYSLPITYTPGSDFVLPINSTITLSLTNNTTGSSNRRIRIYPNGSFINLPSGTIINVDSVAFYDDAYPLGSLIATAITGTSPVYVRAVVSDPFGSYDITSAAVTLLDPSSTPVITSAAMTEVNDSGAATKTYEYTYTPVTGPEGTWTAEVLAKEGTEDSVTHTNSATFDVSYYLTMLKSSTVISDPFNLLVNPKRVPGATIRYTLDVSNSRATGTTNVVVVDAMPTNTTYVANSITVGGAARTDLVDGDNADYNVTNANAVTVTVGTLGSGASETITFDVTID